MFGSRAREAAGIRIAGAFAIVLTALALGCAARRKEVAATGPADAQSDRLRSAYPQLHEGRFSVIADFEAPAHVQIFQLINASGAGKLDIDPSAGRADTGRSAMRCRLAGMDDVLLVTGATARDWTLKRDWSGFDLLLAALETRQPMRLEVELRGGPPQESRTWRTPVTLNAGWNRVELDLWHAAEHLNLDDVRELSFHNAAPGEAVEFTLDDLILTADRRALLGRRDGLRPELFVERQGHRLNIGVAARYELCFHRGRIVRWYDLAADPNRLTNLLSDASMGPIPMYQRPKTADTPAEITAVVPVDREVDAQEVLELTPARVSIHARHGDASKRGAGQDAPLDVWECRYTFYPSGQVYVDARLHSAVLSASVRTPMWVWQWGDGGNPSLEVAEANLSAGSMQEGGSEPRTPFAVARDATDGRTRLVLCAAANDRAPQLVRPPSLAPSGAIAFTAAQGDEAMVSARFLMTFPDPGVTIEEIHARVTDYAQPMQLRPLVGRVMAGVDAPASSSGFDAGAGAYRLAPEGDVLRVEIDGRALARFDPVLLVDDPQRRTYWLYLDHKLVTGAPRCADGSVLVQVPGAIRAKRTVEVLFKP